MCEDCFITTVWDDSRAEEFFAEEATTIRRARKRQKTTGADER